MILRPLVLLLLTALPAAGQPRRRPAPSPSPVATPAVAGLGKLRVEAEPVEPSFPVGADVLVRVRLVNSSAAPIDVRMFSYPDDGFRINVQLEGGGRLDRLNDRSTPVFARIAPRWLAPGARTAASFTLNLAGAYGLWDADKRNHIGLPPGAYKLNVSFYTADAGGRYQSVTSDLIGLTIRPTETPAERDAAEVVRNARTVLPLNPTSVAATLTALPDTLTATAYGPTLADLLDRALTAVLGKDEERLDRRLRFIRANPMHPLARQFYDRTRRDLATAPDALRDFFRKLRTLKGNDALAAEAAQDLADLMEE